MDQSVSAKTSVRSRASGSNEHEAGAARLGRLVLELGAHRVGVAACDRETEAGAAALAWSARVNRSKSCGTNPAHAGAAILDGKAERATAVFAAHENGWLAVAQRVTDQVADDALERNPVGHDRLTRVDVDVTSARLPVQVGAATLPPNLADGTLSTRPASVPSRGARGRAAARSARSASRSAHRAHAGAGPPGRDRAPRPGGATSSRCRERRRSARELMRGDCHELVLQPVDPTQLLERTL